MFTYDKNITRMKWISGLGIKIRSRVGVFVLKIKPGTLGDLSENMENSQDEVGTKN